ncbi:hypothetical protein GGR92_001629 [Spirosoma lacussanchae]|uniref:hypothetical protein n=1 Tax=Spirosoma lacussanchae TaxID=1884249 RepID=UPI0014875F61|nr:hypothetical protein [Spirosoma lacussanchae]
MINRVKILCIFPVLHIFIDNTQGKLISQALLHYFQDIGTFLMIILTFRRYKCFN